jgi:uncharacterized protein (TIGR02147 family)
MPNIFNYLDYREYLKDFYSERKVEFPCFSYKHFANKAGFRSKGYLFGVINGNRNLSEESILNLQNVLKLGDKAFSYFSLLVAFNQAKALKQKNLYFEQLMQYNRRSTGKLVMQQQYQFYSKWYHNTIRELLTIIDFKGDYAFLCKMIKPQLSVRQVKASIELMLKLGLVSKQNGRYVPSEKAITTGDEVRSLAVQNFHVQNQIIAAESIDTTPAQERDISCIVGALSQKGFETIKQEIQQFRKKLIEIIDKEAGAERVYHISIHLFPTSHKKS